MKETNVHFMSTTDEWETPQDTFNTLNSEFHFTLDVCATHDNAKCENYFTKSDDSLKIPWYGTCWMNPPYGREIGKWVKKAYETSLGGWTVVCLIPSRTDTTWWHEYVMKANEIRFIRGRLKFGGAAYNAPFPSCLAIFRGNNLC